MGKIIAIGGGEIGRPGYPVETTLIDKEIIRISGIREPRLLFLPTAADDSESYVETVHKHFGENLGCVVETLYLIKEKPGNKEIQNKVFNSNIVYIGGGNTLKMLRVWRIVGLDKILLDAYRKDIVLSGVSAGAICWFRYGSSDSRRFANPNAGLIKIKGLNLFNVLCCPHYDVEADRKLHLKELMEKTPVVALAIDNCCAIEIINDSYRIITSKDGPNAYKVYWRKGIFYEEIIEKKEAFSPVAPLLSR
jgi:dipeptidase E